MKNRKRFFWRALIFLTLCLVMVVGFYVIRGITDSVEAEKTLHRTYIVANMLQAFVEDNCQWPQNWDQLEPYRRQQFQSSQPPARPFKMEELRERVDIRFEVDGRLPSLEDFKNQRPFHPHLPYYFISYERDLEYVRQAVVRCRTYKLSLVEQTR